jgi:hypothetical protein
MVHESFCAGMQHMPPSPVLRARLVGVGLYGGRQELSSMRGAVVPVILMASHLDRSRQRARFSVIASAAKQSTRKRRRMLVVRHEGSPRRRTCVVRREGSLPSSASPYRYDGVAARAIGHIWQRLASAGHSPLRARETPGAGGLRMWATSSGAREEPAPRVQHTTCATSNEGDML